LGRLHFAGHYGNPTTGVNELRLPAVCPVVRRKGNTGPGREKETTMKRTTTKGLTTAAVGLSLLLAGSAALAGQGRGGREGAPGRGIRATLDRLDLTDAQEVKVKELFESERPKYGALRQEGRAAREALRAAAKSATPDPTTVGNAFLRVDAHRKTLRAERESSRKKLEALLTPEQRAKLEGIREGRRSVRGAGFGRGPHAGRAGGPRPPQS
jgi:Spy/CpxP family protein refolding chaperone